MIVTLTHDHCGVRDADDCTRLHVTADGLDDAEAGTVLERAELGHAGEAGHLWLAIDALRSTARAVVETSDWDGRFDAMIAYAGTKGWLDASGRCVSAHIERSGS